MAVMSTAGVNGALPFGWIHAEEDPALAGRSLVRYPEKTDLILLTSRPPQLETPMKYFDRAITPNEAFYVRYHIFPIPTRVDLATWRLQVTGHVERPLELSLDDLKTKFSEARSTNARATAAAVSNRACWAGSGATAPLGTPNGAGCGCGTS
jgi:DMSO/TMAO reductase YedYZ molybdopterin-dependent catalytic subunit